MDSVTCFVFEVLGFKSEINFITQTRVLLSLLSGR